MSRAVDVVRSWFLLLSFASLYLRPESLCLSSKSFLAMARSKSTMHFLASSSYFLVSFRRALVAAIFFLWRLTISGLSLRSSAAAATGSLHSLLPSGAPSKNSKGFACPPYLKSGEELWLSARTNARSQWGMTYRRR